MVEAMELQKELKQTEVGIIPCDWNVKKVGECLLKNPDYGINAAAVPYNEELPVYLRITDITEDGKYSKKNMVSVKNALSSSYYLQEGDLVFARTGASVGKAYLYDSKDGKLVFAGFLIRVKANRDVLLPDYLKYFTQTKLYWNWIATNSMRTGQPGINGNEYKELIFPLPPTKTEQTAIVAALNDTDALITQLEKLIAKKRAIKQGAMQELLKPKEGWEPKKLENIADIEKGEQLNREAMSESDSFPVYNGGISPSGFTDKWNTAADTIIISEGGNSCGYVNFIKTRFWRGGHCYRIQTKIDKQFTFQLLKFYEKAIMSLRVGSGLPNIQRSRLVNFKVLIPKPKQQIVIAKILSDMDAEIEVLGKKLEKYKMIKQGMMQNLLTGKIRLV